jgi:uncharacterized protein (DUF1330 family)
VSDLYLDPSRDAFDAFKALPRDTPIHMINLLRFRDRAAYPVDHALVGAGLTGREAYANYGRESGPVFQRLGGQVVWRGTAEAVLIGPADEQWDMAFIAAYPHAGAFMAMVTDPEYRIAVVHRQAAVLTSRLIRTGPPPVDSHDGTVFG